MLYGAPFQYHVKADIELDMISGTSIPGKTSVHTCEKISVLIKCGNKTAEVFPSKLKKNESHTWTNSYICPKYVLTVLRAVLTNHSMM